MSKHKHSSELFGRYNFFNSFEVLVFNSLNYTLSGSEEICYSTERQRKQKVAVI